MITAGAVLAIGLMGSWLLNSLAKSGRFILAWDPLNTVLLGLFALACGIMSSWLLFRVLVWKSAAELLRPLCSIFLAISMWAVDFGEFCPFPSP